MNKEQGNGSQLSWQLQGAQPPTDDTAAEGPSAAHPSCGARERAPAADRPYLDDALDVAVSLGEVHGAELGRALPVLHVGAEDGARALPLSADHSAHGALRPTPTVSAAAGGGSPSPSPSPSPVTAAAPRARTGPRPAHRPSRAAAWPRLAWRPPPSRRAGQSAGPGRAAAGAAAP